MQVLKLFRNFEILFEGKTCHNLPERQYTTFFSKMKK